MHIKNLYGRRFSVEMVVDMLLDQTVPLQLL